MKNNELGRLREENKRLSRENEYLRHRVEQLGERKRESSTEDAVMAERLATAHTSRVSGYLGFALLRLRTSRWFRIYDKTSFAVRGFLLASKLFRIGMGIFALIGIGAQVLLVLGIFAILLPALILFSVIMAVVSFFSYRKRDAYFADILHGKKIFILFYSKKCEKARYFPFFLHDLSKDGVVLVVARSVFVRGHLRVRQRGEALYEIPFGYYFALRKKLPAMGAARVIVIH